jgi:hypothetical protein
MELKRLSVQYLSKNTLFSLEHFFLCFFVTILLTCLSTNARAEFSPKNEIINTIQNNALDALFPKENKTLSEEQTNNKIDNDHARVFLDKAMQYFHQKEYDKAKNELKELSKYVLPPEMREGIEKLSKAMDDANKGYSDTIISQGVQYDNYINSDQRVIIEPPITSWIGWLKKKFFGKQDRQRIEKGTALTTNLATSFTYRLTQGMLWNVSANAFQEIYGGDSKKFSTQRIDLTTGPWFTTEKGTLRIPIGFSYLTYPHDDSINTTFFHINPSYERYITPNFSFKGELDYYLSSAKDYAVARYAIKPTVHFSPRYNIALIGGFEKYKEPTFSYEGPYVGIVSALMFPTNTAVSLGYTLSQRDYKYCFPEQYMISGKLQEFSPHRVDKRQEVELAVEQKLYTHFFVSLSYKHIWNVSSFNTHVAAQYPFAIQNETEIERPMKSILKDPSNLTKMKEKLFKEIYTIQIGVHF